MGNLYITPEGLSRLRNLRSRKRIAREDHEKFLRACIKRQKALFKQRRELPLACLVAHLPSVQRNAHSPFGRVFRVAQAAVHGVV